MSATLRHDIPLRLDEQIASRSILLMSAFGAKEADRWGGHLHGHKRIITFAVKLPAQIKDAYELLKVCTYLSNADGSGAVGKAAWTLARKLTVSFGLPFNEFLGPVCRDEKAFLASIEANPGEIATWSAYSDWLTEHNDPRGTVIAEWLDPKKAVKTKYGIPVSVRHKLKRVNPRA